MTIGAHEAALAHALRARLARCLAVALGAGVDTTRACLQVARAVCVHVDLAAALLDASETVDDEPGMLLALVELPISWPDYCLSFFECVADETMTLADALHAIADVDEWRAFYPHETTLDGVALV